MQPRSFTAVAAFAIILAACGAAAPGSVDHPSVGGVAALVAEQG